jgi:hypothetical protein
MLSTHAALRDLMERAFDDWQQATERALVAIPPRVQDSGYVG